jgi:4-amino-4-deoxy-L-arabinose transferase-like glycosyltransferase
MSPQTQKIFKLYIFPLVLAVLVYFPLFYNLDRLPLAQFDEARVAMSSYEMSENMNLLVVDYGGKPDMWSTKPPLTNWAQVFFIKTLGLSVLSVRLPSAIAGLLTCILLWVFCVKYLKNYWLGFLSVIILVTARGFISAHVTRTADYDAMLVLFTTASAFAYYLFIDTNNYKYLRWFFIVLALGVITKSVAGMFMLPGLLLFSLFNYKKLVFFGNKKTWLYTLYFIIPVLIIYVGRELLNPGYIKAAWYWDIAGRYKEQLTGDEPYFGYYLKLMKTGHFISWFWLSAAGVVLGLLIKNPLINKITLFAASVAIGFLLLLSSANTQMLWYEAPVYPFVALLAAITIYWAVDLLNTWVQNLNFNILPYALVIALAFTPYKNAFNYVSPPKLESDWEHEAQALNYYLIDAYNSGKNLDGYKWVDDDWYNPYINFYVRMFEKNKNQCIQQKLLQNLATGDTVIGFLDAIKPKIEAAYTFDLLEEKGEYVKVYKITGRRQQADSTVTVIN